MSELLKINVNEHTEKKNGLTYLSWAWAWAKVLEVDPQATWEAFEFDGMPVKFLPDSSAMVKTAVTIKGHTKTCWLPVMNHRNQAIKGPDAFAINTAIVRCLTKTISMHGLGLYIYAGEDLPEGEEEPKPIVHRPVSGALVPDDEKPFLDDLARDLIAVIKEQRKLTEGMAMLHAAGLEPEQKIYLWGLLPSDVRSQIKTAEKTPL